MTIGLNLCKFKHVKVYRRSDRQTNRIHKHFQITLEIVKKIALKEYFCMVYYQHLTNYLVYHYLTTRIFARMVILHQSSVRLVITNTLNCYGFNSERYRCSQD